MNEIAHKNDLASLIQYFFNEYLPQHRGVSPNTIKSYRDTLKLFLQWLIENGKPTDGRIFSEIRPMDILTFLKHLEEGRRNSIATRNTRLAALKSFFSMCYIIKPETKLTLEVLQLIPMKKTDTPMIDFFEHEDVIKMFAVADRTNRSGAKDYLILNLLYDTGMRASEIANAKLSGFDSKQGTLEIIGKGSKWRKVHLWPRNVELLGDYIENWRSTPKPLYHDFLFINRKRTPLTRFGVRKICLKYLEKAGIKKQLPSAKRSPAHSWRHTAAVNMIRQGKSLLEVCVRLGHKSVDTTQKYLKLDLTIRRERVEELIQFTQRFTPLTLTIKSADLKTTDEMVSFLKSI